MEKSGISCPRKEEVEFKIKTSTIHPDFDYPYFDVAVIELASKINFTEGIASVCLSSASTDTYW